MSISFFIKFSRLSDMKEQLIVLFENFVLGQRLAIPPKALECGNLLPLLTSQPRCDAHQPISLRPHSRGYALTSRVG